MSSIGSAASSVVAVDSTAMGQTSNTATAVPSRSRPTSSLAPNSISSNLQEESSGTIGVEVRKLRIGPNFFTCLIYTSL